jgi:hypothetical protein
MIAVKRVSRIFDDAANMEREIDFSPRNPLGNIAARPVCLLGRYGSALTASRPPFSLIRIVARSSSVGSNSSALSH